MSRFIFLALVFIVQIGLSMGAIAAIGLSDSSYARVTLIELVLNFIISFFVYREIFKKFISSPNVYPSYIKVLMVLSPIWITVIIGLLLINIT